MIKNVVFDLDGTLWQTKKSYIYAYQKLCQKYHKTPTNSFDDVLNYMGVKVDYLLKDLFPEIIDQTEIIKEAVNYSIEYIIKNPNDTCFTKVFEILKNLSENYKVYIISNCPKEYVETFFSISNTKEFITNFYTIELGEKSDHLKKISNNYQDKTLFIGDDYEDYIQISNHEIIYFVYAKYGYKNSHIYDYSINNLTEIIEVLKIINRKERILKNNKYEIISSNDTNLTLITKNEELSYFGFLNVSNLEDLQIVIKKLKDKVKSRLIGPIDGNTFYTYRFAYDNFDWHLYPDLNNSEEELFLFLNNGFREKQYYRSTLAKINDKIYKRSQKIELPIGYKVKFVEGKECYKYIEELYEVAIDAFKKADFYEDISKIDFIEMYLEALKLCNPELILIYFNEELVAFNFCYEDLEKRFYVSKTIGIKSEFRNRIVLMKIIASSYDLVVRKGYDEVLYHFLNDRTKTLDSIYKGYEKRTKRYVLLEYNHEKKM